MELKIYLDAWIAQEDDGTVVLKHGYDQFVEDLENLFELNRLRTLDEAARAVSMLKAQDGGARDEN
jgi:hypothetical protein